MRVVEYATATHAGRVRRKNEDAYYADPPLFAVADGMGGALAGELASRISVQTLGRDRRGGQRRGAPRRDRSGSPTRASPSARPPIRARPAWARRSRPRSSGPSVVTFAHVGDSRAYLWRGGVLTRLSDDHSLVAEWVRAGALAPEEAAQHPQRSVITRALGADWQVDVDVWTTPARTGDVILLCTDGLSGFVDDAAVAEVLAGTTTSTPSCAPSSTRPTPRAARTTSPRSRPPGGRGGRGGGAARRADGRDRRREPDRLVRRRRSQEPPTRRRPRRPRCARRSRAAARARGAGADRAAHLAPRAGAAAGPRRDAHHRAARRDRLRQRHARAPTRPGAAHRRARLGRRAHAVRAVGRADRAALVALRRRGPGTGKVAVYQGLPYDLGAGVKLFSLVHRSRIPAATLPAARRRHLFDHSLRSSESARALVAKLEQTEP